MENENKELRAKKKFYKKWWFWVIVVIVILSILGSSSSEPKKIEQGQPEQKNSNEVKSETFKIGDAVKIGNSVIAINKIETSTGGQYSKPTEGNKWINLNITIENTDSSQQYITTLGQMFLRDGDGNSYQVAVTNKVMENPGFGLDGTIIAKSKRTGWVGFEVKNESKNLQFQYNGSMFGGKEVLINLE